MIRPVNCLVCRYKILHLFHLAPVTVTTVPHPLLVAETLTSSLYTLKWTLLPHATLPWEGVPLPREDLSHCPAPSLHNSSAGPSWTTATLQPCLDLPGHDAPWGGGYTEYGGEPCLPKPGGPVWSTTFQQTLSLTPRQETAGLGTYQLLL